MLFLLGLLLLELSQLVVMELRKLLGLETGWYLWLWMELKLGGGEC